MTRATGIICMAWTWTGLRAGRGAGPAGFGAGRGAGCATLAGAGWAAVGVVAASGVCPVPVEVGWAADGVCVPLALGGGVPVVAAEGVPSGDVPSGAEVSGAWFVVGEVPSRAGEVSFPPAAA